MPDTTDAATHNPNLPDEPPATVRCGAKRQIKQVGYGEADLHCQVPLPEGDEKHLGRHEMVTHADGVVVSYWWLS